MNQPVNGYLRFSISQNRQLFCCLVDLIYVTLADIGNDVEKNVDNRNSLITAFSHFGDRLVMFGDSLEQTCLKLSVVVIGS